MARANDIKGKEEEENKTPARSAARQGNCAHRGKAEPGESNSGQQRAAVQLAGGGKRCAPCRGYAGGSYTNQPTEGAHEPRPTRCAEHHTRGSSPASAGDGNNEPASHAASRARSSSSLCRRAILTDGFSNACRPRRGRRDVFRRAGKRRALSTNSLWPSQRPNFSVMSGCTSSLRNSNPCSRSAAVSGLPRMGFISVAMAGLLQIRHWRRALGAARRCYRMQTLGLLGVLTDNRPAVNQMVSSRVPDLSPVFGAQNRYGHLAARLDFNLRCQGSTGDACAVGDIA